MLLLWLLQERDVRPKYLSSYSAVYLPITYPTLSFQAHKLLLTYLAGTYTEAQGDTVRERHMHIVHIYKRRAIQCLGVTGIYSTNKRHQISVLCKISCLCSYDHPVCLDIGLTHLHCYFICIRGLGSHSELHTHVCVQYMSSLNLWTLFLTFSLCCASLLSGCYHQQTE